MKRSSDRILTTHVGSLPRPGDLLKLYADNAPDDKLLPGLQSAIADVIGRQKQAGVDIVNDGEFGKAMRKAVDFGAWWSYVYDRLAGFELREEGAKEGRKAWTFASKDRTEFAEFYEEEGGWGSAGKAGTSTIGLYGLTCTGPIKYVGAAAIGRDVENLAAACRRAGVEEAFMTSISPATLQTLPNQYYKSDDDYAAAIADAIREEYKAIVDGGFVLQIDDPALITIYDYRYSTSGDLAAYRKWAAFQIEILNYALRDIPEDRVRVHFCWGSWHGPHISDVPLQDVADLLLTIKAQGYSLEAGNVRHEHEWKVWQDVKLPSGKILFPGVVSHATNVIEHPDVVADRIVRFAKIVGRENVVAGTDCGLGGRLHRQIAWAKLAALGEGARLASKQLWG